VGENLLDSPSPTNGIVAVDRFSGGVARGICYQITHGKQFVQLTSLQAREVANTLLADLNAQLTSEDRGRSKR